MKIAVSAESTIDLPKELLDKFNISTVAFTITLGNTTEKDGEITNDKIISYVNEHKVLPKTSAVNEEQFTEHFETLLKDNEYLISLDLNQKEMGSVEFSKYLSQKFESNGASVSFVIGGSYGLSDELKNRANSSITLSKMTFPHQLARLVLLEQIYRAFKILNNETYHK